MYETFDGNYREWEELEVMLDRWLGPFPANETLGIENGVLRVSGELVLGSVTNQTFSVSSEGHIRRGNTVSLVIGDDFNSTILEYSNTAKTPIKRLSI